MRSDYYGVFQVVMLGSMKPAFEEWLSSKGLNLFPIPLENPDDDLPTYGIGLSLDERASV